MQALLLAGMGMARWVGAEQLTLPPPAALSLGQAMAELLQGTPHVDDHHTEL